MKWILMVLGSVYCIMACVPPVSKLEQAVWMVAAAISFTGWVICCEIERINK